MKARIGVADSSKVIEIDVDDAEDFRSQVESVFTSPQEVFWFTDVRKRSVGVPVSRIAYVEIDSDESSRSVGFAPGT